MENKNQTNDSVLLSNIYSDTCTIIEDARDSAYRAVNTALTIRNWMLGERIARELLGDNGRAEYGKTIIVSLAEMLTKRYGKGFDFSSLYQYVKFHECFPLILDAVRPKLQLSDNQQNEILDAMSPKSQNVNASSRQLYVVRMYDQLQRTESDNPTIGLLLCSETSDDMARYSVLHGNEQIFQAKYLTYLPTKEELIKEYA